jgi:LemA protein
VIALWIVLGIIVVIGIALVMSYNRFVSQRNLIRNSWANIDTELRRRYDLIPNLVETVKGYAAHEREVFEEVARTRSAAAQATGTPAEQAAAEGPFVAALGRLFAVAENYPELKANQNVLELQEQLTTTENQISFSRQHYNATVLDYNTSIATFPNVLIAGPLGFGARQFFDAEPEASQVPTVNLGYGAQQAPTASAPTVSFPQSAPPPQVPPQAPTGPTPPPPPAP